MLASVVFTRPFKTIVEELTEYVSDAPVLLWIVTDDPESAVTTPDTGVIRTAGADEDETSVADAGAVEDAAFATVVVATGAVAAAVCDWCAMVVAMATPLPRVTRATSALPPTRRTILILELRYMNTPTFRFAEISDLWPSWQRSLGNSCGSPNASLRMSTISRCRASCVRPRSET